MIFQRKSKGRKEGRKVETSTYNKGPFPSGRKGTNERNNRGNVFSFEKKMQIKNSYSLNTEEIFERVSRVISHSVSFLEIPPRTARFR